jgi:pantoate--beta-alanine ligase
VELTRTAKGLRARTAAARAMRKPVGFVPTMGFFHQGHLSLMRRAREERGFVIVSIFVNPLQFGPSEDFEAYPRDLDGDLAAAEGEEVDLVFAPEVEEMYPEGHPAVTVDPGPLGDRLEGASRPGHLRGVVTVVAKLFHLVGPSAAYFGEKDAQQLAVIRRMVRDLSFPVDVVGCPIVREEDGLALSSRNVYLSPAERTAATCLNRALAEARSLAAGGERDADALRARMAGIVGAEPLADLDYATVVDEETFEEIERLERPGRALVAARVGKPRLIDNLRLDA